MGWRDGCERRTIVKTKTISTALQAANAPVGVHKIAGVAGLYLKIGEAGTGSYFYRYRLGDRRREIGLGSRDKVSLADACKAAKAWAVLRDEGHDPIETRRRERADNLAKSRAQQPITFKQMAETYLQAHGPSWKHRYAKAGWWNPLAKFAFPIIGGSASTRSRFATSRRSCSALKEPARRTPPDGSDRASNWCSTLRSLKGCARRR